MSGKIYGYVRVSTKNQNEERQLIAMRNYGVAEERIIVEKQSGKDFDRPGYRRLLRRLHAGDTLVIASLDRLGRSYAEIQDQWRVISKERGIAIVVLDMPLLNTKDNAELVGQLITDLVLQLLSFVAQTERESIRTRQREGIEAAKARGVRFGRPRLALPDGFPDVVKKWRRGEFTALEAAQKLGISRSTFFRRVRELRRMRKARQYEAALQSPEPRLFSGKSPDIAWRDERYIVQPRRMPSMPSVLLGQP
ncbi:MAG: recombinase family protein [Oscillospiraceae bacterium]|nr:recombinase family protein [Oscillospiraceae bacterium]